MKTIRIGYYATVIGLATALAGCASQTQLGAPSFPSQSVLNSAASLPRHHHSMTFNYTGAQQNFTVPKGVRHVTVQADGGKSYYGPGGGYVKATIPVTPGESLAIFVGGNGWTGNGNNGGFNGGGVTGVTGNGGGGASDVRQGGIALANRVVVAGGAGGDGVCTYRAGGGSGGGLIGGNGGKCDFGGAGGGGGGQTSGGGGGEGNTRCIHSGKLYYANGSPGILGIGGTGGPVYWPCGGVIGAGGGGGGGYYGGGGGGGGYGFCGPDCHPESGGGGGGSSYIEPSAKNVINQQGGSNGGVIIISW